MSLRRKVEINNQEFSVWGKAPWMVVTLPKTDNIPEHYIIIEASMLSIVLSSKLMINSSSHRYNAFSRYKENGALLPVAFVGTDGRARADEICKKLNFNLG